MTDWTVTEIAVKDVPSKRMPRRGSKYMPFIQEVLLRLEQTPKHKALCFHLNTNKVGAQQHMAALRKHVRRSFYVTSRIAPNGTGTDVYIWRGKNWCDPFLLDGKGEQDD